MDAVEGVVPIPTVLGSGKGKIVAELFLPSGPEPDPFRIQIVGKASNMEATDDLRNNLRDGFTLNMQMSFAFTPERYFRAAFRAAFLSVFKVEGFEYALSEGAGQVRQMLNAETPVLEKVIMEAYPERDPPAESLVMPLRFNDIGECYCALLRLRTKRTRYILVFLPGKAGSDWSALEALYQHAPRLRLETTPHGWDSQPDIPGPEGNAGPFYAQCFPNLESLNQRRSGCRSDHRVRPEAVPRTRSRARCGLHVSTTLLGEPGQFVIYRDQSLRPGRRRRI
jgi:hypothetical protein